MRQDRGKLIRRLVDEMDASVLDELLALAQNVTSSGLPSPYFTARPQHPTLVWLVKRGLVSWMRSGTGGPMWNASLTNVGWLVLLERCRCDLLKAGLLPPDVPGEPE